MCVHRRRSARGAVCHDLVFSGLSSQRPDVSVAQFEFFFLDDGRADSHPRLHGLFQRA